MLCACANIGVTVDGKVVAGHGLHHLAGVHRPGTGVAHTQHTRPGPGQPSLSGLSVGGWAQRHGIWPLLVVVPHSGSTSSVECGTSAPSDLFQRYVTLLYI